MAMYIMRAHLNLKQPFTDQAIYYSATKHLV